MTADPYARLHGSYVLGALDADECRKYEAHLVACRGCQASLAEISAIPSLLDGLDESVFAPPPEAAPPSVPDSSLPRLLQAAGRQRARRRMLTTALGMLAAACTVALIVLLLLPWGGGPNLAPRAMVALVPTPIHATVTLRPRSWGTEIDLTCWYQRRAAQPQRDRYELIVRSAAGATDNLGSWQVTLGRRVLFTSGTTLTETQIKNLQITELNGPVVLTLAVRRQ